jgi:hypothetical protein
MAKGTRDNVMMMDHSTAHFDAACCLLFKLNEEFLRLE